MSRPPDEKRRAELVERCLPYLAEHGVATLSLRPLAAALGTSDRMLIHYFGSKEALIGRVLDQTRPDVTSLASGAQGDVAALAALLWADLTGHGPQEVRVRLLLEVMALALSRPDPYRSFARAAVHDWVDPLAVALRRGAALDDDAAAARASALVSGLRGLALDRYLTAEVNRTDAAARLLITAATS